MSDQYFITGKEVDFKPSSTMKREELVSSLVWRLAPEQLGVVPVVIYKDGDFGFCVVVDGSVSSYTDVQLKEMVEFAAYLGGYYGIFIDNPNRPFFTVGLTDEDKWFIQSPEIGFEGVFNSLKLAYQKIITTTIRL